MTLPRCETSYGAKRGDCAAWMNADTLCDRPLGHLAGDLPHRGHAPDFSGRWIECDDQGNVLRRSWEDE